MQEENTRSVFDLESSRRIQQISLFNEKEIEEEQEEDFVFSDFESTSVSQAKDNKDSFEFEFDFTDDADEDTDDEIVFDFDQDEFETDKNVSDEDEDMELEELNGMAHPPSHRLRLIEERKRREEALGQSRGSQMVSPESFKEKWEVPAYERKKVNLTSVPHSSERNVSRYNLNDDSKIIGNNKFLHDNVD